MLIKYIQSRCVATKKRDLGEGVKILKISVTSFTDDHFGKTDPVKQHQRWFVFKLIVCLCALWYICIFDFFGPFQNVTRKCLHL